MNRENYQKALERILCSLPEENNGDRAGSGESAVTVPRLFLHSCCAPCSSYVLEYLREYFSITVFYFNPNITDREEYEKRKDEQLRLIAALNGEGTAYPIHVAESGHEPEEFFRIARGLEACPEGGERCFRCFELRLRETARRAAGQGFDYFTTTLTISPLKDAGKINEIGLALAREYGIAWLPSDFKKRDGYKRSVELSAKYGLYRQNYCGCPYSVRDSR